MKPLFPTSDRLFEETELRDAVRAIQIDLAALLGTDKPKLRTGLIVRITSQLHRVVRVADSLVPQN